MTQNFLKGTTPALRIGMVGFAIAGVGVAVAFFSFFIGQRWLGITGFVITVVGTAVGLSGVAYGLVSDGKRALKESVRGAKELRAKFRGK